MLNKHEAFIIEIIIYSHLFIYVCARSKQIRERLMTRYATRGDRSKYHLHARIKKSRNTRISKATGFRQRWRWQRRDAHRRCGEVVTRSRGGYMVMVGGERTAAASHHGMGRLGKQVRKPGQRPRRRVEGSSSAPSHPLETPAHPLHTRARQSGYSTANAAGRDIRGYPPSPLLSDLDPGPASTGLCWRREGGGGSRRLSGVVSSGATPARRFCARVLFRPVVSFFGAARYGTSAVYASAHSHSISRPAKSSEAG